MTSKEKAKDDRLRKIYKSSLAEQNAKIKEAGGGCEICGRPFPKFTGFQDHYHGCCPRRLKEYCGKCNRGVLCFLCNKYLVGVVEKQNLPVDKLLAYIQKWAAILRKNGCYEKAKDSVRKK